MNESRSDLMAEYEKVCHLARCFGAWNELDVFVKNLVTRVVPLPQVPHEERYHEYTFDDIDPLEIETTHV